MTKKKTIRKTHLITPERIEKWTDEEVLTNLFTILGRATISTDFITEDLEEDLGGGSIITHEVMIAVSGDKCVMSEPRALDWPLQPLPMPETFKNLAVN